MDLFDSTIDEWIQNRARKGFNFNPLMLDRQRMFDNAPVGSVGAPGGLSDPGVQAQQPSAFGVLDAASMAPGIGDVIGPVNDAKMYYEDPSSRTWGNYGLSALGALPFVPSMAGVLKDIKVPSLKGSKEPFSEFTLGEDPTPEDIIELFAEAEDRAKEKFKSFNPKKDDTLRFIERDGKVWVWPADAALHEQVIKELNLEDAGIRRGYVSRGQNRYDLFEILDDIEAARAAEPERGSFNSFYNQFVKPNKGDK